MPDLQATFGKDTILSVCHRIIAMDRNMYKLNQLAGPKRDTNHSTLIHVTACEE